MKVLIVDDENSVHEQLRHCIPWTQLGWEVAGDAYNGEEAKRMVEWHRPELVITDIKMPLMDGLRFMEWLRSEGLAAKVIVLSGYGDFEFSRHAFLQGAFDYLLKPVNEAELLTLLGKVAEQLRSDSKAKVDQIYEKAILNQGIVLMQDEWMTQVLGSTAYEENEMIVQAEQFMINLPEKSYHTVVVKLMDLDENIHNRYEGDRSVFYFAARNIIKETMVSSGVPGGVFRNLNKSNEFVLLFPVTDKNRDPIERFVRRLHHALTSCLRVKLKLGVSALKQRVRVLSSAYREALHAVEALKLGGSEPIAFYGAKGPVVPASETGEEKMLSEWKEIGRLLELLIDVGARRSGEMLLAKLDAALHEQSLAQLSGHEMKKIISQLLSKIEGGTVNEDLILMLGELQSNVHELKVDQIKPLLKKIVEQLLYSALNDNKLKSGKQLIDVIKQFTAEHYKSVTLDEISQRFYLNKNYFCSLFKQVAGESFLEYLTKVRIDQAKRLLTSSDLKTYEIAELVGYSDQRYFSQVFRKQTGLQPTQYKSAPGQGDRP